ncbi:LytR/AlgR family response regulator transcription factor [Mucilaginibacter boryungensis]|uniref:LytTR family transcriptional regulator n=1 Tax=Mucilaginibacter boryungensis TaxID=768480 RepID=A0ABR9XL69_9SPHI|nr:LytTR family DNA-binding domain-containing protein [Mucilaginibacter boryungensis]MBE9668142.1 LytTR family transcriptional regulator [Mucilaginibacter boryungensis]
MPSTSRYHDLYFRIILSVVAAHFIVVFGEKDSIFQLLLTWDYYRSVLLSAVIAFILISIVHLITVRLDIHYDWNAHTVKRIALQFLLGVMLPGVVAFVLATIYFRIYDIDIFVTRYLQYDFPVILGMILFFNVYYLTFYYYLQMRKAQELSVTEKYRINQLTESKNTEVIVASRGTKNIPISVSNISYIFHEEDYNFIRTFEKEDFLIAASLDAIQEQLSPGKFFRANRQMLVNIEACEHFENIEHQKIQLQLRPKHNQPVIISQKRAKEFRDWIKRKSVSN